MKTYCLNNVNFLEQFTPQFLFLSDSSDFKLFFHQENTLSMHTEVSWFNRLLFSEM